MCLSSGQRANYKLRHFKQRETKKSTATHTNDINWDFIRTGSEIDIYIYSKITRKKNSRERKSLCFKSTHDSHINHLLFIYFQPRMACNDVYNIHVCLMFSVIWPPNYKHYTVHVHALIEFSRQNFRFRWKAFIDTVSARHSGRCHHRFNVAKVCINAAYWKF